MRGAAKSAPYARYPHGAVKLADEMKCDRILRSVLPKGEKPVTLTAYAQAISYNYASRVTSLNGWLTHGRITPCAPISSVNARSLSMRTLPRNSFVAQVPHWPCRQPVQVMT